jgi:hypothetical protein
MCNGGFAPQERLAGSFLIPGNFSPYANPLHASIRQNHLIDDLSAWNASPLIEVCNLQGIKIFINHKSAASAAFHDNLQGWWLMKLLSFYGMHDACQGINFSNCLIFKNFFILSKNNQAEICQT